MVFLLHDINDGFMEAAKMANYAEQHFISNSLLVMFIISWVATRLTYFPLWVIRSCLHEPIEVTSCLSLSPKAIHICHTTVEPIDKGNICS